MDDPGSPGAGPARDRERPAESNSLPAPKTIDPGPFPERKEVDRAELPYLSPHRLRHTFATVALEAGVLTKVVADVLGHSSATITADLYSHTTEPSTRDASDPVASAMFGGRP